VRRETLIDPLSSVATHTPRFLKTYQIPGNEAEFAAYGVLAAAAHGHRHLAHELARLGAGLLGEAAVAHALEAARAARWVLVSLFVSLCVSLRVLGCV
jgi:hypothetical protein